MKIQVFRGLDSQWYVRIRARNGRVLMTSEGYSRKSGARRLVHLLSNF